MCTQTFKCEINRKITQTDLMKKRLLHSTIFFWFWFVFDFPAVFGLQCAGISLFFACFWYIFISYRQFYPIWKHSFVYIQFMNNKQSETSNLYIGSVCAYWYRTSNALPNIIRAGTFVLPTTNFSFIEHKSYFKQYTNWLHKYIEGVIFC